MARKSLSGVDLAGTELQNAVIQNLATAPADPARGQVYFDTTSNALLYWDGAAWRSAAGSNVLVLNPGDPIPPGTPDGTIVYDRVTGTVTAVTYADFPTDGSGFSAHRGGGQAPFRWFDGSMTAFREAVAAGATLLDLDTQTTADGVLVVMHDDTVDRTTRGTGLVSSFAYADLPLLDMRNQSGEGWAPEPVPTLDQVMTEFGGKVLITIEPKDANDVDDLAALIKSKGLQDSVFMNVKIDRASDIARIRDQGIKPHVWGVTTTTQVDTADNNGAFLIEVPASAAQSLVDYARAKANIQRIVSAPITKLSEREQVIALGLDSFVSDSIGYVDRSPLNQPTATDISQEIASRHVGAGWQTVKTQPATLPRDFPLFEARGLVISDTVNIRRIRMGSLNGTRAASGSITIKAFHGASNSTSDRSDYRVMVPREQGNGDDASSHGYVIGLRNSGELVMWTSSPTFGSGISLGTSPSSTLDYSAEHTIRFSWTATTVTLERLAADGSVLQSIGPVANTDWRGPDIYVGDGWGTTPNPLTISAIEVR